MLTFILRSLEASLNLRKSFSGSFFFLKIAFIFSFLFLGTVCNASEKFFISGTVTDSISGETLPYTNVFIKGRNGGVVSNQYGFYSISCPEGNYEISFSFLGYKTKTKKIKVSGNQRINIELSPKTQSIEEITVNNTNTIDLTERRLSKIDIKAIKELPSLLGEADLLRSIQRLPGVTSVTEVGRGFNVRGGAGDQNLMILDEAIVYNASHLFGSYSVFNPDIIKDVKFYKSGIPASYGGRLSSVMDITQKEGNMKSFRVSGGLGLISSRLTLEGPIAKDKASFIVSARKSYIDMFFKYLDEESLIDDVKANFYDINTKINYILNENNRLFLSFYTGNDVLRVDDYNQEYGNITATFRFNHIFNSKLFSNTSLIYSDYNMIDGESVDQWAWEDEIGLDHYEFKNEFIYYTHKNQLEFGLNSIFYNFNPGELKPTGNDSKTRILKLPAQHALESAIYFNNVFSLNSNIEIQAGLRFSMFHYLGPEEIYNYEEGIPRSISTIVDTVNYKRNEVVEAYNSIEPRIGLKLNLDDNNSLKLSYNKTAQYIHLISNSITPSPYDMWKPSNNNIEPMVSHQFSLGYFTNVFKNTVELSVESFYKKMHNTLEVKPGADIVLNRTLDADLIDGNGYAYGFELMLNKIKGKHKGMMSYAFTRSLRKPNETYSKEKILPNDYYPSDHDIPHKLSLTYTYKAGTRGMFSADFTYMTGRPVTFPDGQYIYFGSLMPYYSGKNQHRMPDYHRLDLAYTLYGKKKANRKWNGYWVFSLYNVYARKNAYSIYIERKSNSKNTEATRMSIFGSIIPSVSYSFEF